MKNNSKARREWRRERALTRQAEWDALSSWEKWRRVAERAGEDQAAAEGLKKPEGEST